VAGNTYGHLPSRIFRTLFFFHFNLDFLQRVEAQERAVAFRDYPWLYQYLNPSTSYMKRQRSSYEIENRKQAARAKRRALVAARTAPVRAYPNSLVPLGSYGYKKNTQELKVFDIDNATYNVNTSGSFTLLCVPQQGDDMTNRDGRKIKLQSLYIRGLIRMEPTITPSSPEEVSSQLCRVIIFVDYQPNAAAPGVTDVLKEALPQSQLNLNNRDRFKIIKDKTFVFDSFIYNTTATQSVAAMNRTIHPVKIFKRLNINTIFNATNGTTIASISSGALYMLCIGTEAAGGTDGNLVVSTRVRFSE